MMSGNDIAVDDDVDRQAEAAVLVIDLLDGIRRLLRGAEPGDVAGHEALDVEDAPEQRRPRPDDLDILDAQPRAAFVGDDDARHPRVRRERPLQAAQRYLPARHGDHALDPAHEAGLLRLRFLRQGGAAKDGEDNDRRDCAAPPHQKACPRPT